MTLDLQRCAIDGHRAPPSGERLLQLMFHDRLCGMAESNDNMECDSFIKDCIRLMSAAEILQHIWIN